MIDANEKAAEAFEIIGSIAGVLSSRTGPLGIGALAVGAISEAIAGAIRHRGMTVDEIVKNIVAPREIQYPWDEVAKPKE